jgi:hypothetical protein
MEGMKCVHELTMEGLEGRPMGASIYYVVLACSWGPEGSGPDPLSHLSLPQSWSRACQDASGARAYNIVALLPLSLFFRFVVLV